LQVLGWKRNEKATKLSLVRRRIEAPISGTLGQDHGHPVANARHELVRWAGSDGACDQARSLLATLHGPDTRETEGPTGPESDEERRPPTSVVLSPFVETVGHDE